MKFQTIREEFVNSIIHGVGLLLSVIGLYILLSITYKYSNTWLTISCGTFGAAFIILYTSSVLYHSSQNIDKKKFFRKLDHISIYLVIAASYTPFTFNILTGNYAWTLFIVEWSLAIIGTLFKIYCGHKYEGISTLGYLLMGWLIVIAINPMLAGLPTGGLLLLAAGGLLYTLGVPFYFKTEKKRYYHAIWHAFVLLGSICHFFVILYYVVPSKITY